jgi:hypothetical protein
MKRIKLVELIKEIIQETHNTTLKSGDKIVIKMDGNFYYLSRVELNGNKVDYDDINKGIKNLGFEPKLTIRNSPKKLKNIADELKTKGISLKWEII